MVMILALLIRQTLAKEGTEYSVSTQKNSHWTLDADNMNNRYHTRSMLRLVYLLEKGLLFLIKLFLYLLRAPLRNGPCLDPL